MRFLLLPLFLITFQAHSARWSYKVWDSMNNASSSDIYIDHKEHNVLVNQHACHILDNKSEDNSRFISCRIYGVRTKVSKSVECGNKDYGSTFTFTDGMKMWNIKLDCHK